MKQIWKNVSALCLAVVVAGVVTGLISVQDAILVATALILPSAKDKTVETYADVKAKLRA